MQNYSNHRRFYIPHHFILLPLLTACLVISVIHGFKHPEDVTLSVGFSVAFLLLLWESYMMRAHYGLKNQDRIIRLEMRLRYFQLTGQRFETVEKDLSSSQIMALRFASDEELPALAQRAVAENLPGNEIKKSIQHWYADTMRV